MKTVATLIAVIVSTALFSLIGASLVHYAVEMRFTAGILAGAVLMILTISCGWMIARDLAEDAIRSRKLSK